MKVIVLGETGMVGSRVVKLLRSRSEIEVIGTSRMKPDNFFEVLSSDVSHFLKREAPDFVINCIGVVKSQIDPTSNNSIGNAIEINSLFPIRLASESEKLGVKVIQIATDCVYSGKIGNYVESSIQDSIDVYGKSKSLGEAVGTTNMNIRVSVVGPERYRSNSLLSWFLNLPLHAEVPGFQNHLWNGVTSQAYAKVVLGIMMNDLFKAGTFHLVPDTIVSKFDLLKFFASDFNREDLKIVPTMAAESINRTLRTDFTEFNEGLWSGAGYQNPPSIEELVKELGKVEH